MGYYRSCHFTNSELADYARKFLRYLGVDEKLPLDVVAILRRQRIWTRFGEKTLTWCVVEDADLPGEEGSTKVFGDRVEISLTRSTIQRARRGDGRARMTIAHELAHAVLHDNVIPLARTSVEKTRSFYKPSEDVEHHAKYFAAAVLISEVIVADCDSPEEIAERCGVSLAAARIHWSKLEQERDRIAGHLNWQALRASIQPRQEPAWFDKHVLSLCPRCGDRQLSEVGVKQYCFGCEYMADSLADGDAM